MDRNLSDQELLADLIDSLVSRAKETVVITNGDIGSEAGPIIEFVNAAAERLTGQSETALIGQPLSKIVLPAAWPGVLAQLRAISKSGETIEIELRAKSATGQEYWIELSTVPVLRSDKRVKHFVRIGRDVTARKQAEQQRETTQRLLASVFGVIDDPLLVANDKGAIIMANAALGRQLGWGVFDTIGKPATMLLVAADRPELGRLLGSTDAIDQTRQIDVQMAHRNGTSVAGRLQLTTIKQPDSQTFYVIKLLSTPAVPGRDPTFEQAVRQAMGQRSGGGAPVVAGKLQLVGLDTVRERLGDRWPEMAERALAVAERVIQKYMQPGDIVRRSTDDGFLVFFGRLSETEAQFKARAIGDEIREKLIGELPELMEAQIAAFAASVPIEEAETDSEEAIVEALGRRLEDERRQREQSSTAQAKAALRTAKAIFQHLQTDGLQAAPILVARVPKSLRDPVETLRSLGHTPFSLEMEVFLLASAGERILASLGQSGVDLIIIPVRVATLSQPRDVEAWLKVARTLGDTARKQVVAEVTEVPRDIAQIRMRDITMRLSALFRTIAFELPIGDPAFVAKLPDATRIVTIGARKLAEGGGGSVQAASRLTRALTPRNCRLILKDAQATEIPTLAKAGIPLFLPRTA